MRLIWFTNFLHRNTRLGQRWLRLLPPLISALGLVVALGIGVGNLGRFADHVSATLEYRYALDGQEGTLLYEARLIQAGEPLYQPLQPDRVVAAPYPPVHYLALVSLEQLTNPQGDFPLATQEPIFLPGRLLALAATLSTATLLALLVWRVGGNLSIGMVAACIWLAFPPVQLWATRIKPDTLALTFTTAGLLAVSCYLTSQHRDLRLLIGAAIAFTLAFFTKQTAVAAAAATGLTLLLAGMVAQRDLHEGAPAIQKPAGRYGQSPRWRRWGVVQARFAPLLAFALPYLLLVAGLWLSLDLLTAGQFTFHVWGLHPTEWWSFGRFRKYARLFLVAWPLMFIVGLSTLFLVGRQLILIIRRIRPAHTPPVALIFCLVYAMLGSLTIVGAGTTGSHHNHLLEPLLALTAAATSVTALVIQRQFKQGHAKRLLVGSSLLLLLIGQLWIIRDRPDWYAGEFDLREAYGERFVALITTMPGEVIADDVGLLLAAGRPLRYDDPATMGPAARVGLWDQDNLLQEVADQRFDLIILPFDVTKFDVDPSGRWTPEFLAVLREQYRILYRDKLFSYVPRE